MTNEDRIKRRIENDKRRRAEKKAQRNKEYDNYDNMLDYRSHLRASFKCLSGVSWKGSVQKYALEPFTNNRKKIKELNSDKPVRLKTGRNITIRERGKERKITAVSIEDRVFQKVLTTTCLKPIITHYLIYDNGASLENKGVTFTRKRVDKHLAKAIETYDNDFYILKFDFKKFFESIPHSTCRMMLNRYIKDQKLLDLIMTIIYEYKRIEITRLEDKDERDREFEILKQDQSKGICLGSEISQILALLIPNDIDHHIKDKRSMKHYVRYMDDGIVFGKKEELQELLLELEAIADELGIAFNRKKTYIVHCRKGFTFLQRRYIIKEDGTVCVKLTRSCIVRQRRKLKKLFKMVKNGERSLDDAYNSMQAWLSLTKGINAYHARRNMIKLYNELFDGYKITAKYFENQELYERGKTNVKVLQNFGWDELYRDRKYDGLLQVPA